MNLLDLVYPQWVCLPGLGFYTVYEGIPYRIYAHKVDSTHSRIVLERHLDHNHRILWSQSVEGDMMPWIVEIAGRLVAYLVEAML